MLNPITPRLGILPQPQLALWPELAATPSEFTLYGGTAIALHLAHRESVDFDFFGAHRFDPDQLLRSLSFLADAQVVQRQSDTLTVRVERGGPVLISFFATPELGRIKPPHVASDTGLRIASLIDLAGMKADVVQKRAEPKDYRDIDALLTAGITLPEALAAARVIQGPAFNPQISLKALSYFEDGGLQSLPQDLKRRLMTAVRDVDLGGLPQFAQVDKQFGAGDAA
jgi:hypothetical protein